MSETGTQDDLLRMWRFRGGARRSAAEEEVEVKKTLEIPHHILFRRVKDQFNAFQNRRREIVDTEFWEKATKSSVYGALAVAAASGITQMVVYPFTLIAPFTAGLSLYALYSFHNFNKYDSIFQGITSEDEVQKIMIENFKITEFYELPISLLGATAISLTTFQVLEKQEITAANEFYLRDQSYNYLTWGRHWLWSTRMKYSLRRYVHTVGYGFTFAVACSLYYRSVAELIYDDILAFDYVKSKE